MAWSSLLALLGLGGVAATSAVMSKKQMAFQAREAQKQRDWLTEMSNTAHKREVDDLRSAGLNPILSAGGSGADVSGGAAASIGQLENPVSSGIQAAKTVLDMENVSSDTDLKSAQAVQSDAASKDLAASAALKNAQAAEITNKLPESSVKGSLWSIVGDALKVGTAKTKSFIDSQINKKGKSADTFRDASYDDFPFNSKGEWKGESEGWRKVYNVYGKGVNSEGRPKGYYYQISNPDNRYDFY